MKMLGEIALDVARGALISVLIVSMMATMTLPIFAALALWKYVSQ